MIQFHHYKGQIVAVFNMLILTHAPYIDSYIIPTTFHLKDEVLGIVYIAGVQIIKYCNVRYTSGLNTIIKQDPVDNLRRIANFENKQIMLGMIMISPARMLV